MTGTKRTRHITEAIMLSAFYCFFTSRVHSVSMTTVTDLMSSVKKKCDSSNIAGGISLTFLL